MGPKKLIGNLYCQRALDCRDRETIDSTPITIATLGHEVAHGDENPEPSLQDHEHPQTEKYWDSCLTELP